MPSVGSLNWQEDSKRLLLKIRTRIGMGWAGVREWQWIGHVVGVFCLSVDDLKARADSLRQMSCHATRNNSKLK